MAVAGLIGTFLETKPALHRFLILRGANAALAEDVLQEISVKLSEGKIGPVSEPRAYLYRMAANLLLLHRRGERRRVRRESDWTVLNLADDRGADRRPSAELNLIQKEQIAIISSVLDRLPERTRDIFLRFRVSKESQRSIAGDLGISLSAVEKHLTRAYHDIAMTKSLLDADRTLPRHLNWDRGDL